MSLASRHRHALCDTAAALSPDAPTLCAPWTARDLLAHLVVRERRPDAMVGRLVPALSRHSDRVRASVASVDYADLVQRVRAGPPRWMPTSLRPVDNLVNGVELMVHHEDLRRAAPGWQPLELDAGSTALAWATVTRLGRVLYRSSPVGVVVVAPGHGRSLVRRPPSDARSVVVTGPPLELLLHAFGRAGVARVEVEGRESDVAALAGADRAV